MCTARVNVLMALSVYVLTTGCVCVFVCVCVNKLVLRTVPFAIIFFLVPLHSLTLNKKKGEGETSVGLGYSCYIQHTYHYCAVIIQLFTFATRCVIYNQA